MCPRFSRRQDLVGRRGQRQVGRMTSDFPAHRVDLVQRAADGFRSACSGRNRSRSRETRRKRDRPHARNIHLAVIVLFAEVVAFIDDHLGRVVVQVDHYGALQQAIDARGIDPRLGGCRKSQKQKQSKPVHEVWIIA